MRSSRRDISSPLLEAILCNSARWREYASAAICRIWMGLSMGGFCGRSLNSGAVSFSLASVRVSITLIKFLIAMSVRCHSNSADAQICRITCIAAHVQLQIVQMACRARGEFDRNGQSSIILWYSAARSSSNNPIVIHGSISILRIDACT